MPDRLPLVSVEEGVHVLDSIEVSDPDQLESVKRQEEIDLPPLH